ncbi:hypothetical protein [Polaromonas sp. AER18D-145]|uniref:hypothetical protein n=1 Tax=Polaromonas sp. AER18D-145 TaxID=1977060 RepID=UPI000BBBD83D|nr:hypothetical protein [Polaromonas sp. AER18D-145]
MADVSVGQSNRRDQNENEVEKDSTLNKTFGEEGTNKAQPKPDPNAKPIDVGGKWIEPSPFTR